MGDGLDCLMLNGVLSALCDVFCWRAFQRPIPDRNLRYCLYVFVSYRFNDCNLITWNAIPG